MTKEQKTKLKKAIVLFKQGNFNAAKNGFSEIMTQFPKDKSAILYTGYIALLENRLKDAKENLQKGLELMPGSKAVKSLLADVFYRQDDFVKASFFMNSINRKANAAKLGYLGNRKVYDIVSLTNRTELKFLKKDPLPLIKVSINGTSCGNFLIDTGGSELIIDTEYAKNLRLKEFGTEKSTFGGGKKATIIHSYIDSIQLGDFEIKNLPVILLDTRRFSTQLYSDEFQVDGILGTCIFYHFLTTLDYVSEKIVFEILNNDKTGRLEDRLNAEAFESIPFWMAGDHFMLANGKINNSSELLLFIDTGLGGYSFTCPKSTLKKFGFTLRKDRAGYGSVGGGRVKTIPFDIENLSLSRIEGNNLKGTFGAFPPSIENAFGFKINGLISHEFFRDHKVVFDYSKMLLYIK